MANTATTSKRIAHHPNRKDRQQRALSVQSRASITPEDQLKRLDAGGYRAVKERAKLLRKIEIENGLVAAARVANDLATAGDPPKKKTRRGKRAPKTVSNQVPTFTPEEIDSPEFLKIDILSAKSK